MQRFKQKKLIYLIIGILYPLSFTSSKVNAGSFGAEIFCNMRDNGNDHRSSWEAAYSYIKKQKGGIFKVSPKQAASQITETVIREREKFSYCVEYLDNLHPDRKLQRELQKEQRRKEKEQRRKEKEANDLENKRRKLDESNEEFSEETFERYSY
tara:strand:- start:127 stop:588 length:462 start_codon:yes stop_codon:yes gene_type:complete